MNENHKKSSAVHKINFEPHFLAVLLQAAMEARHHLNNNEDDSDVALDAPVVDFLEELVKHHPEEEVAKFYISEIHRLREEASLAGA